jgi:hypothetical protein
MDNMRNLILKKLLTNTTQMGIGGRPKLFEFPNIKFFEKFSPIFMENVEKKYF